MRDAFFQPILADCPDRARVASASVQGRGARIPLANRQRRYMVESNLARSTGSRDDGTMTG